MWAPPNIEAPGDRRGGPSRRAVLAVAVPALAAGVALSWPDATGLAALLARYEPTRVLTAEVDAVGPGATPRATAELIARLCDRRLAGEEARRAVVALWQPRVMLDATATPGEPVSINSRLVMPPLESPRDDGPVLAWRLVEVRVDDGEPVVVDAPPTLTRLGADGESPRWDGVVLPAGRAPGRSRVSCVFEYELRGVAAAPAPWRQTFERCVVVLPADG